MNCPNCGSQNAEGVTFCANCGTRLRPAQPAPVNPHLTIQLPSLEPREAPAPQTPSSGSSSTPQTPPYGNPLPSQPPSYDMPAPSQPTTYGAPMDAASSEGGARTYDVPASSEPAARTYDMPAPSPLPQPGPAIPTGAIPPGPAAPPAKSGGIGKWLLFGCLGALVLLLVACGALVAFGGSYVTDLANTFAVSSSPGISNLATSRSINEEDRSPIDPTSTFTPDETIFITYAVGGAEAGQSVDFEYFYNDQPMGTTAQAFDDSGDFTGYFSIDPPNDPGSYRADLTYNGTTESVVWTVE